VRFDKPFDQGANLPTTAASTIQTGKHNVLVLPEPSARAGLEYVPGKLTIEAPTHPLRRGSETRFYDADARAGKGKIAPAHLRDADAANGRRR